MELGAEERDELREEEDGSLENRRVHASFSIKS